MPFEPRESSLIADIGGTYARFALALPNADVPALVRTLPCADYPDFVAAAKVYLNSVEGPRPTTGLCAIAASVTGDYLRMTNCTWAFSIEDARVRLGLTRLRFINDWVAQALAVPHLAASEVSKLCGGEPRPGYPIAVLGAGTGLGVSGLIPSTSGWVPIEGEGGHVTISPISPREAAVAAIHRRRFGHCSAERIASGIGLISTYEALCELDRCLVEPLQPSDITARAATGHCPQCREAVQLFCLALASTASNLAITLGTLGGVYLGGGVLQKLENLFDTAAFCNRFVDKGRFRDYLDAIPIYTMHAQEPALLGLAKSVGRAWPA